MYKTAKDFLTNSDLQTTLTQFNLQKKMLCPYHDDTSPSLEIYDANESKFGRHDFYCYACKKGDNLIALLSTLSGLTNEKLAYLLNIESLNDFLGEEIDLVWSKITTLCQFEDELTTISKRAHRYLINRGLTACEISKYKLGYISLSKQKELPELPSFNASNPAVWIPNLKENGTPIGGCINVPGSKYLFLANKSVTPYILYGDQDKFVICEGIYDAIYLKRKLPNHTIICVNGVNTKRLVEITNYMLQIIGKKLDMNNQFFLAFDNDRAGNAAATEMYLLITSHPNYKAYYINVMVYTVNCVDAADCMQAGVPFTWIPYAVYDRHMRPNLPANLRSVYLSVGVSDTGIKVVLKENIITALDDSGGWIDDIDTELKINVYTDKLYNRAMKMNTERKYKTYIPFFDEHIQLPETEGHIAVFTGYGGAGKTKTLIYIICNKMRFESKKILIFCLDMLEHGFMDCIIRQFNLLFDRNPSTEELHKLFFHSANSDITFMSITGICTFIEKATALDHNIGLVVVDNFDAVNSGSSNLTSSETEAMKAFQNLMKNTHITIYLIVQPLKENQSRTTATYKGSSAILSLCDVMIIISKVMQGSGKSEQPTSELWFRIQKNRGGIVTDSPLFPQTCHISADGLVLSEREESISMPNIN